MTWVAVGVGAASIATSLISSSSAKKKAKRENAKAEREIQAKKAEDSKRLDKGVKTKQMAQMDLARTYEGAANISPEAQYANNQNERATASAIDKAMRSGSSTGEIMNMVSGLTSKGQDQAQKNSARQHERRTELMAASKGAAIGAAESGLAGEEGQIALEDKAYNRTQQKQLMNNETARQEQEYWTSLVGDAGAGVLYSQMYGGGGGGKGSAGGRSVSGDPFAMSGFNSSSFTQPTRTPKKVKY